MSQLYHGDDGDPADHHAGGPEQGVEQHVGAVQFGQDHALLNALGVVEAGEALVLPEVFHHDIHQRHGFFVILPALGDVRTLGRKQREKNTSPNLLQCLFSGGKQGNLEVIMLFITRVEYHYANNKFITAKLNILHIYRISHWRTSKCCSNINALICTVPCQIGEYIIIANLHMQK